MNIEMNEQERKILISCIEMAAREGFYRLDDDISYDSQIVILKEFMKKLGCSEEQINDLDYC
jgi:hypothetical protein